MISDGRLAATRMPRGTASVVHTRPRPDREDGSPPVGSRASLLPQRGSDAPAGRRAQPGVVQDRCGRELRRYTTDPAERADITASPLRTSLSELAGLPPALVIAAEADVLRDEGRAYAAKLRAAGVPTVAVRYGGIIHDFVMLNALHDTAAARAAVAQAIAFLRERLSSSARRNA